MNILSILPRNGGISGIAEKCNITRRTIYQFEKSSDVRQKTRVKILDACMQTNPEKTLKFLVERSKEKSTSILMIYLSHLYKKVIGIDMSEEFDLALRDYMETREKHFGLISDEISDEVETMTKTLYTKALEYGIEPPLESVKTTKASHIVETIPYVINFVRSGGFPLEEISKTYGVPLEFTQQINSYFEVSEKEFKFKESKTEVPYDFLSATQIPYDFKIDRKLPEGPIKLTAATT